MWRLFGCLCLIVLVCLVLFLTGFKKNKTKKEWCFSVVRIHLPMWLAYFLKLGSEHWELQAKCFQFSYWNWESFLCDGQVFHWWYVLSQVSSASCKSMFFWRGYAKKFFMQLGDGGKMYYHIKSSTSFLHQWISFKTSLIMPVKMIWLFRCAKQVLFLVKGLDFILKEVGMCLWI